jgi:hypothetical protein
MPIALYMACNNADHVEYSYSGTGMIPCRDAGSLSNVFPSSVCTEVATLERCTSQAAPMSTPAIIFMD